jgi:hypothetical protein
MCAHVYFVSGKGVSQNIAHPTVWVLSHCLESSVIEIEMSLTFELI